MTQRLRRLGSLNGLFRQLGVAGQQGEGHFHPAARVAHAQVGDDHARRRVLGKPPPPDPVHRGKVPGMANVDIRLDRPVQGRAGCRRHPAQLFQHVIGLPLDG